MGKRILRALLWALAAWVWVGMANVFLGTPDLSAIAAVVTAGAVLVDGPGRANARARALLRSA